MIFGRVTLDSAEMIAKIKQPGRINHYTPEKPKNQQVDRFLKWKIPILAGATSAPFMTEHFSTRLFLLLTSPSLEMMK